MEEVRALGSAAAEEWCKGLEASGKEKVSDAARWEHWEASGAFKNSVAYTGTRSPEAQNGRAVSLQNLPPTLSNYGPPREGNSGTDLSLTENVRTSIPGIQSGAPGKGKFVGFALPSFRQTDALLGTTSNLPPKPTTPTPVFHFTNPIQSRPPMPMPIQPHIPQPRSERSIRDVNQMKVDRRAEIEKRCLELKPPILPSTLIYMDSFAAAIQIPMALTDNAWDVLKPRLLAQREIAEGREQEQRAANQHLQAKAEERRQQEAQLKEARENLDREWEEMQKPVREKVNNYADDVIREDWRGGETVNHDNCAQFAADVLLYVRKRFFEVLAYEDAMLIDRGMPLRRDSPNGSTRKLTLENMKWVFEAKIKPLTELYRKEIFLCSVCDNPSKYYALDAVIQHYAAKHTSALSMGTTVVYWRADWPEEPPFDPHPDTASARGHTRPHYGQLASSMYPAGIPPSMERYSPTLRPSPPSSPMHPPHPYQNSAHQQTIGVQSPPGVGHHVAPVESFGYSQQPPQFYPLPQRPYESAQNQFLPPSSPAFTPYLPYARSAYSDAGLRSSSTLSHPQQYGGAQASWMHSSRVQPTTATIRPAPPGPPGQPYGIYQVQIEELARNAREIWDGTAGVRDIPSSVRVQVIIHHVVLRFTDKFTNEPNLALFTDGLNNNSQMKPIRTLSGLSCKACTTSAGGLEPYQGYSHMVSAEKRVHTLPALLAHFQSAHIEHGQPRVIPQTGIELPRLDWKFDMVELPEDSVIGDLINAPGINFAKLTLIATVLPKYFPSPLPRIGPVPDDAARDRQIEVLDESPPYRDQHQSQSDSLHSLSRDALNPSTPSHALGIRHEGLEVTIEDFPKFVDSPMHDAPHATEPAREDEYDPHRPAAAYVQSRRVQLHPGPPTRSHLRHKMNYASSEMIDRSVSWGRTRYRPVSDLSHPSNVHEGYRLRPVIDSPYQNHDPPDFEASSVKRPQSGRQAPSQNSDSRHIEVLASEQLPNAPPKLDGFSGSVKEDQQPSRISPPTESMNAAEQFLDNFENIGTTAYPDHERALSQHSDVAPTGPLEDALHRQLNPFSEPVIEQRSWRSDMVDSVNQRSSARATPAGPLPTAWMRRVRSPVSDIEPRRARDDEYDPQIPEPGTIMRREYSPVVAGSRGDHEEFPLVDLRYPPNMAAPREREHYDDYNSRPYGTQQPHPRSSQRLEQVPGEAVYFREQSPNSSHRQRQAYDRQSPETFRRQYPPEEQVRYGEIRPARQYRYVDDQRYVDATYREPVEYIKMAPRETQAPARYIIERPIRELPPEYVEFEGGYQRGHVFERNGQLYTRAPPSHDAYQDQYDRSIRYQ